jgi:hypothetical protein
MEESPCRKCEYITNDKNSSPCKDCELVGGNFSPAPVKETKTIKANKSPVVIRVPNWKPKFNKEGFCAECGKKLSPKNLGQLCVNCQKNRKCYNCGKKLQKENIAEPSLCLNCILIFRNSKVTSGMYSRMLALKRKGFTQKKIGEKLGIHMKTVNAYLNKRMEVPLREGKEENSGHARIKIS